MGVPLLFASPTFGAICAKELPPRQQGITTYFNLPLITQVNDNEEEIQEIAHKSRSYGMQFHHIYVEGLALQDSLNSDVSVDMDHVVDIATRVRRDGSRREIPACIIQTVKGEIDFEYRI